MSAMDSDCFLALTAAISFAWLQGIEAAHHEICKHYQSTSKAHVKVLENLVVLQLCK